MVDFKKRLEERRQVVENNSRQLNLLGTTINLDRIGINFYPNEQQIECLETLVNFFSQSGFGEITLEGAAGTGKTSIVKILLEYFRKTNLFQTFNLTAPTNRAKLVLEALSGKSSKTIHSLFGIKPNIIVEKLDYRDLKFITPKDSLLPEGSSLIIDECGMINDTLYDVIVEACKEYGVRLMFMGDRHQLMPVNQYTISKTFNVEHNFRLVKVERQSEDNPGLEILENLRREVPEPVNYLNKSKVIKNSKGEDSGFLFTSKTTQFVDYIQKVFSHEEFKKDKLYGRVLCYTNNRVDIYNKIVRETLGYRGQFNKGELLIGCDNYGVVAEESIVNACDYVILEQTPDTQVLEGLEELGELPTTILRLKGVQSKSFPTVTVLDNRVTLEQRNKISEHIEYLREEALFNMNRIGSRAWVPYMNFRDSFQTTFNLFLEKRLVKPKLLTYGYAVTTHRCQGGTLTNVLVDMRDLDICSFELNRQQLYYTALSRSKNVSIGLV